VLNAIVSGDLATYKELCHPSITCFEPEAKGHLVEGRRPCLASFIAAGRAQALRTRDQPPAHAQRLRESLR
jgi:hypothetical protein